MDFQSRLHRFTELTGKRLMQRPPEPAVCYDVVQSLGAQVFLEIGSAYGGSLYVYAGACSKDALLISVDQGQFSESLMKVIEKLQGEGYTPTWIEGNSHKATTLERVKSLLNNQPVDFLHLDGDHTAKGVLKDWNMYWPLVRKGGIAAVHDIHFAHRSTRVCDAWPTIREQGAAWCEIVGPFWRETNLRVGIGLVWK